MGDEAAPAKANPWGWRALYAALAFALGALAWHFPVLDSYELTTYDLRVAAATPQRRDPKIVLVAIDDESFKQIKRLEDFKERRRWPWPSSFYSRALERLFADGAAVVALDLLTFDTPSAPSYQHEDTELAAVAARHPGRVVVAERYDHKVVDGTEREEWFLPIKPIRKAVGRGYVNALQGRDGVVRRFQPTRKRMVMFEERSFAVAIAEAYQGKKGATEGDRFVLGEKAIHLDDQGRALIRPTHGGGTVIPFWKILAGEGYDAAALKDAIVLIGPTTIDLHDRHSTPLTTAGGPKVDGVSIQADIVDSLLHGSNRRRASPGADLAAGVAAGTLGLLVAIFAGALFGPFLLLVAGGLYWIVAAKALANAGLWLAVARPLGVMGAVYLGVTAARLSGEERQRRAVREMFSAYVSPEVLTYLEEHPGAFSLSGERRDVTVFFSDVQGFTDMSETVTPAVLANILNRYFTPMSNLVMDDGGYVDKFIGDCVMAVFGVPKPLEDHAVRCCRSALRQLDALAKLNEELQAEFGKTLNIRIGINSGLVSAGNMGSDTRFEYTVMGDVVNLSSRLEGANKGYGTRIMVGQNTYAEAKDHFEFRALDLLRVKGKLEPVAVYELLGKKGEVADETLTRMRRFEEGLEQYRQQGWDEAIEIFEELLEGGEDGPAKLYLERCQQYRDDPPPKDWGGVYVMTSK